MIEKIRIFVARHRYALAFCYVPFYFLWFTALEKRTAVEFNYMHCVVDDWIPFCEYFIVPYLFWFLYVSASVVFLALQPKYEEDFFRCAAALIMGMTASLIICTVFPNAQSMRPEVFENNNIFTRLVAHLYSTDTSTNVFPSVHCYNSFAVHMALWRCRALRDKKGIRIASLVVCVLICISTMALKQHAFLDFVGAGALYLLIDKVVYGNPANRYPLLHSGEKY